MRTYNETLDFIRVAHKGQLDKAGEQYWLHPYKVSQLVKGGDTEKVVALLHDVLEDTKYTVKDLREMGYSEEILRALMCLTHIKDLSYKDYIEKLVMTNPISIRVKMADLTHNMDETRLPERLKRTEKFIKRSEKYKRTYNMLEEYISNSQRLLLPTILGFEGWGGAHGLFYITSIIVADFPNRGNKIKLSVEDMLKYKVYNFSNFRLNSSSGEVHSAHISSSCFEKQSGNSPIKKYFNRDIKVMSQSNANTLVLCAKSDNDLYWVSGVNFDTKLLSKHQLGNLINRGWILVNGSVRTDKGVYTVVPNRILQELPHIKPALTRKQYQELEIKIDSGKSKRKMETDGQVTKANNKGFVPVTDKDRMIANSILNLGNSIECVAEKVTDKDKELLERISLSTLVAEKSKRRFYDLYKDICSISKDEVIDSVKVPQELSSVVSFMDMLREESTLNIVNNIKLYKTFDDDEHETYINFMKSADNITNNVQEISDSLGLELYGLSHRVKSPRSYCNKIRERCELVEKKSKLDNISDILRFTQVVPDLDNYGKTVNKSLDEFRKLGYNIIQVKNFWGDNMPYKGINCKIESPEGIRFEMQYHTPDFLLVKDAMHTWYEIRRTGTRKGSEKWNYVVRQELELSKTVKVPKDYDLVKEV